MQARSLLGCGVCERLIDPYLHEDYNKEEMEVMMVAARLCLLDTSSKRPTMKMVTLFYRKEYPLTLKDILILHSELSKLKFHTLKLILHPF